MQEDPQFNLSARTTMGCTNVRYYTTDNSEMLPSDLLKLFLILQIYMVDLSKI